MKIVTVKKTQEVTAAEWEQIVLGFNEEFDKAKTVEELVRYYKGAFCGYSYHGISQNEAGAIMGFSSVMPINYTDASGAALLTGLSLSTFVRKEFRGDIFIFDEIYRALRNSCKADGMKVILGVPNKNSFKYLIKLLGFKFLYNLPYFALPLTISKIAKRNWLKPADYIITAAAWLYIKLTQLIALIYNPEEKKLAYNIAFTDEAYVRRFHEAYSNVSSNGFKFTYRIYEEKGITIAYLFQFTQKGKRNLSALARAAAHIIQREKADMIAFVGKLNLSQHILLPLPEKKHPQPLPLTIDVLVPKSDDQYEAYLQPANWNFGLMNLDVR